MRKRMFLPIVLSLCMVQFGAFAATARGNSRGANNDASTASVAPARSAVRSAKMTTSAPAVAPKKQTESLPSVGRAATKPTVAARAGTTQKVITNGTKVATATSNTVISQECQDAFYGCMDSFCMIDNASGGRCQCSERNDELLKVMDDIATLDEQSYIMATEGVERIQMGADAEQIIANAKAAGDKVTGKATSEENKKKVRTLDLSLWNSSVFDEDENFIDESIFSSSDLSNAMSKKGAALYGSATKMCVGQMPSQCSGSLNMLQSVYAQKIKSDCTAFENSLKQQKVASTQKLQAAEKALRDAALEKFREENKYSTTGECVSAYARCMETECGTDYSQCITFAAEENIKTANGLTKTNEKGRTIKGVVDIVLSGSTMNQIMSKKTICDGEVLKYCVNHQSEVWDKYLAYAATSLKSAEVNAEDNLGQNCIKDLSTCFKNACAAQFDPNQEGASYDMCLSDPYLVVDFCKVKLDACVVATGGKSATKEGVKNSRLWAGVTAMLAADRVDACTKEVKAGIEEICGEDFAYCAGLNPGAIAELLPTDKLTACMESNNRDRDAILQYVSEIAQGYALQINDKMYEICENAARNAMIKVCGNADTCDTLNLGNMSFDSLLKVELCNDTTCSNSANEFEQSDIVLGKVTPHIRNRVNVNSIVYKKDISNTAPSACKDDEAFSKLSPDAKLQCYTGFVYATTVAATNSDFADEGSEEVKIIIDGLNNIFNNKMAIMLKDKTVHDCMYGKNVTGFRTSKTNASGKTTRSRRSIDNDGETIDSVYVNLLDSYQEVLISKSLELLKEKYDQAEKDLTPLIDAANAKISERLAGIVEEEKIDKINTNECALKALAKNLATNGNECNCDNDLIDFKLPYPDVATDVSERHSASGRCAGYKASASGDAKQGKVCGCFQWDGFCGPTDSHFFEVGSGRNYKQAWNGLYWTDYEYDSETNVCTLITSHYVCNNSAGSKLYCWDWNKTASTTEKEEYKMPGTQSLIETAQEKDSTSAQ